MLSFLLLFLWSSATPTNSDGDFRRTFHTASRLGVPLPPSPAPLVPNPLHNRDQELLWQRWLLNQKQVQNNNMVKRDFEDLQCRGMYDRRLLTRLERICEDCYDLYRDPEVHGYCRSDCFSSQTFQYCLQSLLLDDSTQNEFREMVQIVGKKKKKRRRK